MADAHQPRWLRIQRQLDDIDPWTLLLPLQDDGTRLMAWSAPKNRESFVAIGSVIEYRPSGEGRFEAAQHWWAPIAAELHTSDDDGAAVSCSAPACLAGFAFRSDTNRTEAWDAWGDGALCVPEIVIWRRDQQTVACFTIDTAADSEHTKLAMLTEQLERLIARASSNQHTTASADITTMPEADGARQRWHRGVEAAQAAMATGELQKVVLARSAAFEPRAAQRFDPLATAWALRERQTHSTTFIIRRRDGQAFLGSSPEVLVNLSAGLVETVALAGTRRRDAESTFSDDALSEALLESTKDRAEQHLVATAIVDALAPYVEDLQVPPTPEVVRHPDVQHLRTAIRGQLLGDATIFDLLKRLHPTPAVGGLPRAQALAWLDNNEQLDRGWYAGPMGWISGTGDGEFVVAIRSVLMAADHAAAFAGCGLIADSNPADEWEESQIKLQTVRQGLAAQGPTGLER